MRTSDAAELISMCRHDLSRVADMNQSLAHKASFLCSYLQCQLALCQVSLHVINMSIFLSSCMDDTQFKLNGVCTIDVLQVLTNANSQLSQGNSVALLNKVRAHMQQYCTFVNIFLM